MLSKIFKLEFFTNENHTEQKKKLYVPIMMILLFIAISTDIGFADSITTTLAKIDKAGNNFLRIAKGIGYWAILIKGVTEVVKSGMEGDKESAIKIVLKYIFIYAVLYFFPEALRMVEDVF